MRLRSGVKVLVTYERVAIMQAAFGQYARR
jgi:hypothetical protein